MRKNYLLFGLKLDFELSLFEDVLVKVCLLILDARTDRIKKILKTDNMISGINVNNTTVSQ
jgi:hypothetical protein